MPQAQELASAFLLHLENLLGKRAMAVIKAEIEENYFGKELLFEAALLKRSDLVERAFTAVLGSAAPAIFELALNQTAAQFNIGVIIAGLKPGGLGECLASLCQKEKKTRYDFL
ncbi:MAG: hypothetical protein ABI347_01095 [Nitrososphaera sp.]